MNTFVENYLRIYSQYLGLRDQIMEVLSDADLKYSPVDNVKPLGELALEMGEIQMSYIDSFETFTQDFSQKNDEDGLASSVKRLQEWFRDLDRRFIEILTNFSDEDLDGKLIDRRHGFQVPPRIQIEIYKEALLIFYGKALVYLKGMEKELPKQWKEWLE